MPMIRKNIFILYNGRGSLLMLVVVPMYLHYTIEEVTLKMMTRTKEVDAIP